MRSVDEELERMAAAQRTEAPVVLADDWVLLHDGTALAWVEVRLHRSGAVVAVHLAHRRGAERDTHRVRIQRWYDDDGVDVEVDFTVDGEDAGHGAVTQPDRDPDRPGRAVGLLPIGASSSGEKSAAKWWLPLHPSRELGVALRWVDGSGTCSVRIGTDTWQDRARGVRRLGEPAS